MNGFKYHYFALLDVMTFVVRSRDLHQRFLVMVSFNTFFRTLPFETHNFQHVPSAYLVLIVSSGNNDMSTAVPAAPPA